MSDTKQVPVFVYESILENVTLTIVFRNNMWMVNVLDTSKLMKTIQTTMNAMICKSTVYDDKVVFSGN